MKHARSFTVLLFALALIVSACQPAQPTATPPPAAATSAPAAPTAAPATATPEPPKGPQVGGTLVIALNGEPDTLDVHKSAAVDAVMRYVGASLITTDPDTGDYLPYLAESWSASPDGLAYEFKLRDDVKFHDGSPLTAADYAFTFNRALQNPSTAGGSLRGMTGAEAVDDTTLRLTMAMPNSTLLDTLALATYHQPLSQAYVEKAGDDYGRNPIGVGPYKFKEWLTGEKIVLERNPDFAWGPGFTGGAAPYVETIEFRFIPEYATQLAGLEAGEIDFMLVDIKDIKRIEETGQYHVYKALPRGANNTLFMNTARPPLDDVNVRKAMNMAVDRDVLVKVVAQGYASAAYGPLTPSTTGYWPGVEDIGYTFDLDGARSLMEQAGYTLDNDVLEKDGQPLALTLKVLPAFVKDAEILQEMYRELGVNLTIEQQDIGVFLADLAGGNYDLAISGAGWNDYGLLFALFHSSTIGAFNYSQVNNPELNGMLEMMAGVPDKTLARKAADDVQRYIVEQAYVAPLYIPDVHWVMSNRVSGELFTTDGLFLYDAYIQPAN
jgi:peptide/nickel transport system substrate-binding protein